MKFLDALLAAGGTYQRRPEADVVRLRAPDTPVYRREAAQLLTLLNRMATKALDGSGRWLRFQLEHPTPDSG